MKKISKKSLVIILTFIVLAIVSITIISLVTRDDKDKINANKMETKQKTTSDKVKEKNKDESI